jgi:8-oxo-dGTP pyrophosphatase MutT (NUDIX family)
MSEQAAAIPICNRAGRLEICLIRKNDSDKWGIPKGIVDPGDMPEDTALKEAWEEAGVMGGLVGPPIGNYTYDKRGNTYTVAVYVIHVTDEHPTWPEMEFRERVWKSIDEAAMLLENHPVRSLLALLQSPR